MSAVEELVQRFNSTAQVLLEAMATIYAASPAKKAIVDELLGELKEAREGAIGATIPIQEFLAKIETHTVEVDGNKKEYDLMEGIMGLMMTQEEIEDLNLLGEMERMIAITEKMMKMEVRTAFDDVFDILDFAQALVPKKIPLKKDYNRLKLETRTLIIRCLCMLVISAVSWKNLEGDKEAQAVFEKQARDVQQRTLAFINKEKGKEKE